MAVGWGIRIAARVPRIEVIAGIPDVQPELEFGADREGSQVDGAPDRRLVVIEDESIVCLVTIVTWIPRCIQHEVEIIAVVCRVALIRCDDGS